MKKDITVTAEPRSSRGKNEANRLRVRGLTPAVVYGAQKDAVAVAVDPKEVRNILRSNTGHNTIFNLAIENGENTPVMLVDWQNDPVRGHLLHVDMKRIDLEKRLQAKIPVQTQGEPKGVKLQGGLLEVVTREVEIECLPNDIPEMFTLDVSELMMGQNVRASDIPMTGSARLVSPPDQVIAHVVGVKAEAVEESAVAAATPEPEVIKKGKKDEAAAPAAPAAAGEKGKKK